MHGGVWKRLLYYADTIYTRRYGGQLEERCWSVIENQKARVIAMQLFAAAIAHEDRLWERASFGSGRPSLIGLESLESTWQLLLILDCL